jgi:serine/threonine protein kinase
LICEDVRGRTLLDEVMESGGLDEEAVQGYAVQLVCALRYLHAKAGVLHRDMKLENIVVESGALRLMEFGNWEWLEADEAARRGSVRYIAPELLQGGRYSEEVDAWCLGVVVYALLTGTVPYGEGPAERVVERIRRGRPGRMRGRDGRRLSVEAIDFAVGLLEKNPGRRLTLEQAAEHPFLRQSWNSRLLEVEVEQLPALRVFGVGLEERNKKALVGLCEQGL